MNYVYRKHTASPLSENTESKWSQSEEDCGFSSSSSKGVNHFPTFTEGGNSFEPKICKTNIKVGQFFLTAPKSSFHSLELPLKCQNYICIKETEKDPARRDFSYPSFHLLNWKARCSTRTWRRPRADPVHHPSTPPLFLITITAC